jgi:branched-subunit amino acid ABC-type transport system permease component
MMSAVYATMAYSVGIGRLSPITLVASLVIAVAIAWPVKRLAVQAVRRVKVIRLIDTVVATIVVIAAIFALVLLSRLSDDSGRITAGDRCGDGTGRRVLDVQSSQEPGGPVYWGCVSQEEYEEWAAKTPVSKRQPVSPSLTAEQYFQHISNIHLLLKSVVFGTIAALAGWLYAFGWCWNVRTDEL